MAAARLVLEDADIIALQELALSGEKTSPPHEP